MFTYRKATVDDLAFGVLLWTEPILTGWPREPVVVLYQEEAHGSGQVWRGIYLSDARGCRILVHSGTYWQIREEESA